MQERGVVHNLPADALLVAYNLAPLYELYCHLRQQRQVKNAYATSSASLTCVHAMYFLQARQRRGVSWELGTSGIHKWAHLFACLHILSKDYQAVSAFAQRPYSL